MSNLFGTELFQDYEYQFHKNLELVPLLNIFPKNEHFGTYSGMPQMLSALGLRLRQATHYQKVHGSIPVRVGFFYCDYMLDGCSRITS